MSGLEALLGLLGGAAVVMRLRDNGCHVGGSTCFESEGNRRHFVREGCESGVAVVSLEQGEFVTPQVVGDNVDNFGAPLIDNG